MGRLIRLNLPTLKYRHIRGDMIEVYKMLTNRYEADINIHLQQLQSHVTRGHNLKLANTRFHYDLRKYSFTIWVVNIWNSLPESVILTDSVDSFKNRLDKFWSNQDLMFDYKADLTGIGNRSLTSWMTNIFVHMYIAFFVIWWAWRLRPVPQFLLCFALHPDIGSCSIQQSSCYTCYTEDSCRLAIIDSCQKQLSQISLHALSFQKI